MTQTIYRGVRPLHVHWAVFANNEPLNARKDIRAISDYGFAWGDINSGAHQLSLALLAHHTRNELTAIALCNDFTVSVVQHLPTRGFEFSNESMDRWLAIIRNQKTFG